jgi:small subunit ribosomal protein S8
MMTDPIADMLTRIRNALQEGHASVNVPRSKVKEGILGVLKQQGYIGEFEATERMGKPALNIQLRYVRDREPVIEGIQRVSKPGRRVYVNAEKLPKIRAGLGVAILTTSKGIMSDAEARDQGIGGEVICKVW